jgi:hypothetical protein
MQRGHCDNSQRAFPPASGNSDITPREAAPLPDPGKQSSMPRTKAVSTVPSADRVGRVAITSGRWIVGAGLIGSNLRSRPLNGGLN